MPKTTKAGVTVMVQMGVVMGASMIPEKKVPVSVVHPECNEVGEVEAVVKPIGKSNFKFKISPPDGNSGANISSENQDCSP